MAQRRAGRTSILDYFATLEKECKSNKYCALSDLGNEASVESFFALRLLKDLGYKDSQIKTKESIEEITVSLGGRKEQPYKPDYVMVLGGSPRWLLDAKRTDEDLDDWIGQCSGYSIAINRRFKGEKPLQYYALTNGYAFKLFKWDEDEPILSLTFCDFFDDNQKFLALRGFLNEEVARRGWKTVDEKQRETITLTRVPIEQVKKVFNQCHRLIWKAEKFGDPVPAFSEFVKIMFVKLWEDRRLHEDPDTKGLIERGEPIPADKVVFSKRWIESMESANDNPFNRSLFQELAQRFDESVARKDKKPIFNENETIRLHAGTVKEAVRKLETFDLFGIDNDLNGRLFENFLSSTMRGEHLGQYFTPRSIVDLATALAKPTVELRAEHAGRPISERAHIEKVIDACCGTGGFLIEVLKVMRDQIGDLGGLTDEDKKWMLSELANNSIYGIDAAREPPLARIARINMYLHGDGGSRIYAADSLDKEVPTDTTEGTQPKMEAEELHEIIIDKKMKFDLALTNPPFSMDYSLNLPNEERVLRHFKLASFEMEDTSKLRNSLRSSVMFLERYWDLLRPHGRLITVIDDSVLSGKRYKFARDFIRSRYIIKAVVSLHGDAFQRVGARAKTSLIYLVKKERENEEQSDIFMYETQYVGLDDLPRTTPESEVIEAQKMAKEEIAEVSERFDKYLRGQRGGWLVPASRLHDRLDVKSCLPRGHDIADDWKAKGLEVVPLAKIVMPVENPVSTRADPTKRFTFLKITYAGIPDEGETRSGKEITYESLTKVEEGCLAVSNIAVAFGSTCVIPKELAHAYISSEFTMMRLTDSRFDPYFLWGYLRSPEVRARLLSNSTGISRHRAGWEFLQDIPVPLLDETEQKRLSKLFRDGIEGSKVALRKEKEASEIINAELDLANEWATRRLKTAKPPK
jgi:type I restriction enzyme M protein